MYRMLIVSLFVIAPSQSEHPIVCSELRRMYDSVCSKDTEEGGKLFPQQDSTERETASYGQELREVKLKLRAIAERVEFLERTNQNMTEDLVSLRRASDRNNECRSNVHCGSNQQCHSRQCVCMRGYIDIAGACVAGCSTNDDCSRNEICRSRRCECKDGHMLVNGACKELNHLLACESHNVDITCPVGQRIKITEAMYGRTEGNRCHNGGPPKRNCRASGSLAVVSRKCNGRSECRVTAANRVFGDPCRRTNKYLEIKYICS